MSISTARACLPALVDRLLCGEEVTITRHGEPVAALVRPEAMHTRPVADPSSLATILSARLDQARTQPPRRVESRAGWADELVAQVRADRDA